MRVSKHLVLVLALTLLMSFYGISCRRGQKG